MIVVRLAPSKRTLVRLDSKHWCNSNKLSCQVAQVPNGFVRPIHAIIEFRKIIV